MSDRSSSYFQIEQSGKNMHKKYHIREKVFLGLEQGERDYVIAIVEDTREQTVNGSVPDDSREVSLHIADWRSEIELVFYMDTVEECENSLHKIRTLVEVVGSFKRAIESEIEVISARK